MISSTSTNGNLLLNNNNWIPQLALGTYMTSNQEIAHIVKMALSVGYRHFDCAWIYGNEIGIGQGLAEQFNNELIQRSDVFLTTKIWCSFMKAERVRQQCLLSINDLQCQYLDLLLIHWPFAFVDQVTQCFQLFRINVLVFLFRIREKETITTR